MTGIGALASLDFTASRAINLAEDLLAVAVVDFANIVFVYSWRKIETAKQLPNNEAKFFWVISNVYTSLRSFYR